MTLQTRATSSRTELITAYSTCRLGNGRSHHSFSGHPDRLPHLSKIIARGNRCRDSCSRERWRPLCEWCDSFDRRWTWCTRWATELSRSFRFCFDSPSSMSSAFGLFVFLATGTVRARSHCVLQGRPRPGSGCTQGRRSATPKACDPAIAKRSEDYHGRSSDVSPSKDASDRKLAVIWTPYRA